MAKIDTLDTLNDEVKHTLNTLRTHSLYAKDMPSGWAGTKTLSNNQNWFLLDQDMGNIGIPATTFMVKAVHLLEKWKRKNIHTAFL